LRGCSDLGEPGTKLVGRHGRVVDEHRAAALYRDLHRLGFLVERARLGLGQIDRHTGDEQGCRPP
jgi:hypothetical protein